MDFSPRCNNCAAIGRFHGEDHLLNHVTKAAQPGGNEYIRQLCDFVREVKAIGLYAETGKVQSLFVIVFILVSFPLMVMAQPRNALHVLDAIEWLFFADFLVALEGTRRNAIGISAALQQVAWCTAW